MRIGEPRLTVDGDELRIEAPFECAGRQDKLWFAMHRRYGPYATTEKCDGFLVGLLLLAMRHDEDVHLESPVSERLFYNLQNHYIRLLRILIPSLHAVRIIPTALDAGDSHDCRGEVVTGFSAGVDSFCVLAEHFFGSPTPAFKVGRLVFNNVGSHGEYDADAARILFNQRYAELRQFPSDVGLDFVKIDSNLSELLRMSFVQSHLPRNVAAVMMLQKLFGRYFYASGNRYEDCRLAPSKNMGFIDPASVHLLSTETLDCVLTGCQYTRIQKTRTIADLDGARRYLNVCTRPAAQGRNCSACRKCCRTLLTLEMLGKIDQYGEVFNLAVWRRNRGRFIAYLLGNRHYGLNREIVEYARESGFRFHPAHRLAGLAWGLGRRVVDAVRR